MASPLSQFAGEVIYLDTMLPYGLLRSIDPAIQLFFQRIEQGELRALTSVLTFDELAYRLLLALIKDKYSGSALDQLRTAEEKVISEFAPRVTAELERLRVFPNLTMLDVLVSDLEVMNQAITQYHLRPRDALHYAAMKRVDCYALASNDPHFDRVPDLGRYTL